MSALDEKKRTSPASLLANPSILVKISSSSFILPEGTGWALISELPITETKEKRPEIKMKYSLVSFCPDKVYKTACSLL